MKTKFSFLEGNGEMGSLMRSKDWSSTAVGDPNHWPQSLKTLIGTILHAKFPMFLWWGPELTCFYNDAYRPSLGDYGKHPAILGAPAHKAWSEIWPVIKPLIDKVLLGESVWMEDQLIPIERNGKMEDVYWTFSYSPVSDDQGNRAGVLVICQETTAAVNSLRELKEREDQLLFTIKAADIDIEDQKIFSGELEKQVGERTRELEFKNDELRKMNAELESFAYVSSHDLQEPLRKIQILSSILREKESESFTDSGKDYLHRIQNSAKRMQVLIEDLLTYSRTNDKNVVYVQTDLAVIAVEVIASYKDPIEEKHAIINLGPFCTIKVIPYQIRQLLMNLVGNALKFTRGDIQPRIKIEARMVDPSQYPANESVMRGPYCRLIVADNGIGFDSKYTEKIFEVFQRLHGRDEYAGTGIGLSIVKKIVDNHRGAITTSSNPGEGARFEILLPGTNG
jgi:signal transduction histidine kinase